MNKPTTWYRQTYRHTDIQTYRHTDMHSYMHTYVHTYIRTYIHTRECIHIHQHAYTLPSQYWLLFYQSSVCACAQRTGAAASASHSGEIALADSRRLHSTLAAAPVLFAHASATATESMCAASLTSTYICLPDTLLANVPFHKAGCVRLLHISVLADRNHVEKRPAVLRDLCNATHTHTHTHTQGLNDA